jgi:putative acetyltransferase
LDISRARAEHALTMSTITIDSMRGDADAAAFARLNETWITQHFTLEAKDRETLADPVGYYVTPGGDVLVARHGEDVLGCVALEPVGAGVFELSKMAVDPAAQGNGLGRRLLEAAIDRARELGATSLFLGSNRRLGPAVHLYEAVGFRHVPRERIGPLPYDRADVFMELDLGGPRP